jgi:hypothetical protein
MLADAHASLQQITVSGVLAAVMISERVDRMNAALRQYGRQHRMKEPAAWCVAGSCRRPGRMPLLHLLMLRKHDHADSGLFANAL